MGDDLDGSPQIVTPALLGDDLGVDAPGGHAVAAPCGNAGEALVVAEVQIGFRAVVGDEHLAVLVGAHSAGINVEIGVQLAQTDLVAPRLE